MKHFVQRLEEYSENPEAKVTGAVPYTHYACCVVCTHLGWVVRQVAAGSVQFGLVSCKSVWVLGGTFSGEVQA